MDMHTYTPDTAKLYVPKGEVANILAAHGGALIAFIDNARVATSLKVVMRGGRSQGPAGRRRACIDELMPWLWANQQPP